jgi:hypothetical protein
VGVLCAAKAKLTVVIQEITHMNIKIDMIEFPSNGQTTPAYLARPDDALSHPAVIVIQEWWGLVPHIKEMAERFSAEGYIALAPDLYHGQAAEEPDEARKLAMALDRDKAVAEITAAARYLATLPETQPKRVGVVGWCMGGGLSLPGYRHPSWAISPVRIRAFRWPMCALSSKSWSGMTFPTRSTSTKEPITPSSTIPGRCTIPRRRPTPGAEP